MAQDKLTTGRLGEQLAAEFLERSGYDILARNWRFGKKEIDIIAQLEDLLVIVEVKTRMNLDFGRPEHFISLKKWQNIAIAAGAFMRLKGYNWEVRFDVVAVCYVTPGNYSIAHYKDLYFPARM